MAGFQADVLQRGPKAWILYGVSALKASRGRVRSSLKGVILRATQTTYVEFGWHMEDFNLDPVTLYVGVAYPCLSSIVVWKWYQSIAVGGTSGETSSCLLHGCLETGRCLFCLCGPHPWWGLPVSSSWIALSMYLKILLRHLLGNL